MQGNCKVIGFNKTAPMAIGVAAANIKIPVLDLLPDGNYLLGYCFQIGRSDQQFFFSVGFLFIRFNKIKFSADYSPVFLPVIINKKFIENALSPVITTIRIFIRGAF